MRPIVVNGDVWRVSLVDPDDPRLVDRTGSSCLATTDPSTMGVYVSRDLGGDMLARVVRHEAAHCAMVSHGLTYQLRKMLPESAWVPVEEWVCNFLADYGPEVLHAASVSIGATGGD